MLTQEQRDSLAGIDDNPQCINAVDVFGLQTHCKPKPSPLSPSPPPILPPPNPTRSPPVPDGCKSINNGGTYTTNAIESYIDQRIAVYEEYAKILINGGLSATKLLEVHLTVRPPRLFTPHWNIFTPAESRAAGDRLSRLHHKFVQLRNRHEHGPALPGGGRTVRLRRLVVAARADTDMPPPVFQEPVPGP